MGCLGGSGVRLVAQPYPAFSVGKVAEYLEAATRDLQLQAGTNAETFFLEANLWSQLGRKDKAEALARRILEEDSQRPNVQVFLAGLLIRQDRLEEAKESLRSALAMNPDLPGSHRQLGMVLDRLGEHAEAERAFRAAVNRDPQDATARLLLGRWLLDQGRDEEAVRELNVACRLDPESANARYALFRALSRTGPEESAQEALDTFRRLRATEQSSSDTRLESSDNEGQMRTMAGVFHCSAAEILLRQGHPASAESHLRQALRVDPDLDQARVMLGTLLHRQGRLSEARESYLELSRRHPDRTAYRVNLAALHLELGNHEAAVAELEQVLELDPRQPQALNNLARFYLSQGQHLPRALALAHRLVAVEPAAANYDLLAWALYANNQKQAALQAAEQALERAPDQPLYRERLARLKAATGSTP